MPIKKKSAEFIRNQLNYIECIHFRHLCGGVGVFCCMIDLVQLALNMSEQAVSSTKLTSIIYLICISTAYEIPHANKLRRTALV